MLKMQHLALMTSVKNQNSLLDSTTVAHTVVDRTDISENSIFVESVSARRQMPENLWVFVSQAGNSRTWIYFLLPFSLSFYDHRSYRRSSHSYQKWLPCSSFEYRGTIFKNQGWNPPNSQEEWAYCRVYSFWGDSYICDHTSWCS